MKIPDPTIPPMTVMVASNKPTCRSKPLDVEACPTLCGEDDGMVAALYHGCTDSRIRFYRTLRVQLRRTPRSSNTLRRRRYEYFHVAVHYFADRLDFRVG